MSLQRLKHLRKTVAPVIEKKDTNFRKVITRTTISYNIMFPGIWRVKGIIKLYL